MEKEYVQGTLICMNHPPTKCHVHDGVVVVVVAGEGPLLGYPALSIMDLFVCHYRALLGQDEFWPLCSEFFDGASEFDKYYKQQLAGPIGEYFATRWGAEGHPERERIQAQVEKELRLGHCSNIGYPFNW